jgi:Zn-dependent protease
MRQHAATPAEDARIGLAGPLWGLGVAIVTMVVAMASGSKFWLAVTHGTAVINLFNLAPVWQLDGSRAFNALTRLQRCIALAAVVAAFALARDGILLIVALVAAVRVFGKDVPAKSDRGALAMFIVIVAALSFLAWRAA